MSHRQVFATVALLAVPLAFACSSEDLPNDSAGAGAAPASSGGSTAAGATGGTSTGATSTGATSTGATGGADTGATGGTDTGATGGTGTGATGGADATGGTGTGATGGTASGGAASGGTAGTGGGTGGASGGSSGAGGLGGSAGSAGTGGRGGSAGSTGGGGAGGGPGGVPTVAELVGPFDGFLFTAPCGDGGTGYDCLNTGCANGSPKTDTKEFTVAGTAGKIYNLTFHVYGIVEAKNYQGGTRRAGTTMNAGDQGGDFWYEGGTAPSSSYNVYELKVTPPVTGAPNTYFLNARNGSGEGHESWGLNFDATVKVPGGGKITLRVYDQNCRQIQNCGAGVGGSTCKAPRSINLTAAMPAPASFSQPYKGGNPGTAFGQWVLFDAKSVTAD